MSWIMHDPDLWEQVSTYTACPCNGKCNGHCAGIASIGWRQRSPEEVAAIRAERKRREDDETLARALGIMRERGIACLRLKTSPSVNAGVRHG